MFFMSSFIDPDVFYSDQFQRFLDGIRSRALNRGVMYDSDAIINLFTRRCPDALSLESQSSQIEEDVSSFFPSRGDE